MIWTEIKKTNKPKENKMQTETLARKYVEENGQKCHELIRTDGAYHITRDGAVKDARQDLTPNEAREWYDAAPYKIGARPQ